MNFFFWLFNVLIDHLFLFSGVFFLSFSENDNASTCQTLSPHHTAPLAPFPSIADASGFDSLDEVDAFMDETFGQITPAASVRLDSQLTNYYYNAAVKARRPPIAPLCLL